MELRKVLTRQWRRQYHYTACATLGAKARSYLYTTPDALLYVQVATGVYDHLALRAIPREYRDALGAVGVLLQDLDGRKGRQPPS